MRNILIRDVPDAVYETLQRRAEQRGQSLHDYLTNELSRLATRLTLDESFKHVAQRTGGAVGLEQAIDDLDAERRTS